MSFRSVTAAPAGLLMVGACVLLTAVVLAGQNVGAQTPKATPKQAPQAQAPAQAPASPVRTETVVYEAWTVSCRDTADGKTKKICSATLPMEAQQDNRRIPLGAWIIARNNEGALLSVVQTPQIDIGVLVNKGIELTFGEGKPRKINYVACNPQRCEGTMPMDEPTIRESLAAANGTATVTFWKADNAAFSIKISSIKGIDKAIGAVR